MSVQPGSLVGFALVFFAATWSVSLLFAIWLRKSSARLRGKGPRAERRAASIALLLPIAIGGALTGALIGLSYFGPALGIADHCLVHEHHLHLCLEHGGGWLTTPRVAGPTAMLAALLVVRMVQLAMKWFAAAARLRVLRSVSAPKALADGAVVLCAPSRTPYCFIAGMRSPSIYLGSAVLEQLDDDEIGAVIAHERAHVGFGDLWRRPILAMASMFSAPGIGVYVLGVWRHASERLCDRASAVAVGSPAPVAQAILKFARAPRVVTGCAFIPSDDKITDRVESLLGSKAIGESAARRLAAVATAMFLFLAMVSIVMANPIHHVIETLIGSL